MIANLSLPKLILLLLALFGGVGLGLYRNHQVSLNNVTIQLPANTKASIYEDLGGDGPFNYDATEPPLFTLTSSREVNLKRGTYDVVVDDPNAQYVNPVTKAKIDPSTKEVMINLKYTDQKLASLLAQEKSKAHQSIYDFHYSIIQSYKITKDRLYGVGDWYGVILEPRDSSMDTLRMILHKDGNVWKIAIKEPTISIGQPSNPQIPFEIIDSVNRL